MVEPLPPGHLLVLRPSRPDVTTPARAFPPPRARRSRGRSWWQPLAVGMPLLSAALLLVAQSAMATQASYQITALAQEQARLIAEGDQLRFQLAQARAAKRVGAAAQTMGLNRPAHLQYLAESSSPIALGPKIPETTHGSVWTGVVATLSGIAGRPLDVEADTPDSK